MKKLHADELQALETASQQLQPSLGLELEGLEGIVRLAVKLQNWRC